MHSNNNEPITLSRSVESTMIPAGFIMTLDPGTKVRITQALGGSFTVITELGYMVRIKGEDADALGQEPPPLAPPESPDVETTKEEVEERVWDELKTVYDPEIPVSVAELGLVYKCEASPRDEGGWRVDIDMTLTAPGCGMGDILVQEVDYKIRTVPGVKDAHVELVFDPPWDMSMLPESARLQLGIF